ncbi:ComEC/Rec2 family competence protein [Humidisolicoccus flavus]|uniref:ComEC/Rec2 family competence protein n=1 Tax=Humidisolicoccus flavus TaxID=3111414 RepID=UPI00324454C8
MLAWLALLLAVKVPGLEHWWLAPLSLSGVLVAVLLWVQGRSSRSDHHVSSLADPRNGLNPILRFHATLMGLWRAHGIHLMTITLVASALTALFLARLHILTGTINALPLDECTEIVFELTGRASDTPLRGMLMSATCDGFERSVHLPLVVLEQSSAVSADAAVTSHWLSTARLWSQPGSLAVFAELTSAPVQIRGGFDLSWSGELRVAFLELSEQLPLPGGGLVPGLAIGDTARVSDALETAMLASGLSHLTAVSGANCAVVVLGVYAVAAAFGAPRMLRVILAGAGLFAFVIIVTPEPSVIRAATMAFLALAGLVFGRAGGGVSLLAVTVVILLSVDPSLAVSVGFGLSVLATTGLIVHAMPFARWLSGAMPLPLAVMIAVPTVAQLWCLPVLVVLDSQVKPISIVANLLAGPAAAPATVLGLLGAVFGVIAPGLGMALLWIAWLPSAWIAAVATWAAGASAPVITWPIGLLGLACAVSLPLIMLVLQLSRRRVAVATVVALGLVALIASTSVTGFMRQTSIPDWQFAQCDVGQGSASLIRSGGRVALIDAGPDPKPLQACLTMFGVDNIDLFVVTHFDLDHVGGADAVLGSVGTVVHGPLLAAEDENLIQQFVQSGARHHEVSTEGAGVLGSAPWRVLWPPSGRTFEDGNAASVVTSFTLPIGEVLVLGDTGAQQQQVIARDHPHADIVVVAHHGSADQFSPLYSELGAALAVVPVGENTYGHPRREILQTVRAAGMLVARTDINGAIAVGPGATVDDPSVLWQESSDASEPASLGFEHQIATTAFERFMTVARVRLSGRRTRLGSQENHHAHVGSHLARTDRAGQRQRRLFGDARNRSAASAAPP